jgi:hypothetical protein
MGLEHDKIVGNYMGEQAKNQKEKGETKDRVGSSSFKRGAVLPGLPGQENRSPKAGYPDPANFQKIRNNDPAKGTI